MEGKYWFDRQYQLIIGRPKQLTSFLIPQTIAATPQYVKDGVTGVPLSPSSIDALRGGDVLDWNTIPAQWFEIGTLPTQDNPTGNALQITAKIDQTKDTGHPCTITITNLPEEDVSKIRKDDLLILRAGYRQPSGDYRQTSVGVGQEQFADLFVGQVDQIVTHQMAQTKKTEIKCAEGSTVKRNSRISYSWPVETTKLTILNSFIEFIKSQGIPLGKNLVTEANTVEWAKLQKKTFGNYVARGFLMEEFERFCESVGLRCYLALGKLYIEAASAPKGNLIFQVSPENVLGQVGIISDATGGPSNKDNNNQNTGIQFSVWLDGRISVDKVVRLDGFNDQVDGDYLIDSVKHDLNFRGKGGDWKTTVTANRPS